MKKLLALALAILLTLGLAACSGGNGGNPTQAPTTTEPGTTQEATTATVPVVTDPSFDYMGLFERLEGYWNAEVEEAGYTLRVFVRFHYNVYNGRKPSIYRGVWDSEGSDTGTLTGGRSTGENTAELAFLFPAVTEEGELATHPEVTAVVSVDFSGLDDGEIAIKINNYLGNGIWYTYTYDASATQAAQEYENTL
ncbi:MAG: hypothetical protein LBB75_01045 [Oscillospiraceae bacterium]|jgi:hypothetical protein|nr:hypothetical protein [Oscillospiraceae bacterium]